MVANPAAAAPSVLDAAGHVVDGSGTAGFAGSLQEGDTDGLVELPGWSLAGLLDASGATVVLVVRDHGPARADLVSQQLHTVNVCNPTGADLQLSIHAPAGSAAGWQASGSTSPPPLGPLAGTTPPPTPAAEGWPLTPRRFAVTGVDPDSAGEPAADGGDFPVVLRGYDRQLVDARLGELAGQLEQERRQRADAEQRLRQRDGDHAVAVRDQPTASFRSLGARAAKVFEEAGAVAERLLGEAQEQARLIIDAAQVEAAERLAAAEDRASELAQTAQARLVEAQAEQARVQAQAAEAAAVLVADAERDAAAARAAAQEEIRRAWQQADRERLLVQAEAQRLQTLRQLLNEQLGQVHNLLGLALRVSGDGAADQGGRDADAGRAEPPAEAVEADGEGALEVEPDQAVPPGRATAAE
jgi:cell division septum initiation protein DivIVA